MALRYTVLALALVLASACDSKHSDIKLDGNVPADTAGFANALYQSTGADVLPGARVSLVQNGAVFDTLVNDIAAAMQSINVVLFIWRPADPSDRIVAAVTERARNGVRCRVLVDPIGSVDFKDKVKPVLTDAGCDVRIFRELSKDVTEDRNHRKIAVIDGRVAFTGGFGIYESWLGDGQEEKQWRDTNVRIEGPVVRELQQAFAENWQEAGGELLPVEDFATVASAGEMRAGFVRSTGSPHITNAARLMHLIANAATKRLWIANAYFVPSPNFMEILKAKARAGVDVRVLMPGDINDQKQITKEQRSRYDELLPTGVRLFEYPKSMMHAKTVLVDDHLAVVGSINLDVLSFDDLEEGSLVIDDASFASEMEKAWLDDESRSVEIHQKN